jgi:hypothetical protein
MSSTNVPEEANGTNGEPPPANPSSNPELDISKLQSLPAEQQELFLLTFVSTLSKHVLSLSADDCTAQQFYIKKEIFQILNLPSPAPTRVIRNSLGRCLAHIFGKGDRKLLFETINDLVAITSSGKAKADADPRTKHAAVACLGDLFASAGDSAIGLHQLVCWTLLKLLKASQNNAGLRAACFFALGQLVKKIEGSLDDSLARDIWKQGRNHASNDKGSLVVISACRCLKFLVRHTPYFKNSSDFESLKSTIFKTMEYG